MIFVLSLFISQEILAQADIFTGHFFNRDGWVELYCKLNGQKYELTIIKEGHTYLAEALDAGSSTLTGHYVTDNLKEVPFSFSYENGFYFFECEQKNLPLLPQQAAVELSNNKALIKKEGTVDHRAATGELISDIEETFVFRLPDDQWTYTTEENVFSLKKTGVNGWVKIYKHNIPNFASAKQPAAVSEFLQGGQFEVEYPSYPYKTLSYIRAYKGTDSAGRQVRFRILTIVSPYGGGIHIVVGALATRFEPSFERYMKVIAESVQFIK